MRYTHIVDISRTWPDEFIPAHLVLKCKYEEPGQAVALFREAVGEWLQTTKTGQAAWRESSEDFNYGDLTSYLGDRDLIKICVSKGFYVADINRLDPATRVGEYWDHTFDGTGARTL